MSLDPTQVLRTSPTLTAVIRLTVPRSQMQAVMGPAIGEVMAVVAAQGLTPSGPLFSHHFAMSPETFDFEVGVPVAAKVTPQGRVQPGEWPAREVARTVYRGPYEGLGAAWGEFLAGLTAQGRTHGPELWESYQQGPESNPDPATFCTELTRPLR
jgi:effector-binding domain-containing protein